MASGTINPVAKSYTVDVTYSSKTLTWYVVEFQNGYVIITVDCGEVEVSASTSGSGCYYSAVQNIPLPFNLASGAITGIGNQMTFVSNANLNLTNQTANFRVASMNSRDVMLPVLTVFGVKA